jgi:hypothetical protein
MMIHSFYYIYYIYIWERALNPVTRGLQLHHEDGISEWSPRKSCYTRATALSKPAFQKSAWQRGRHG